MARLHFSLISLVDCAYVGIFFPCGIFIHNGGCQCKSIGALYVGVVDVGLGMVVRWVDVEVNVKVVVVRAC